MLFDGNLDSLMLLDESCDWVEWWESYDSCNDNWDDLCNFIDKLG